MNYVFIKGGTEDRGPDAAGEACAGNAGSSLRVWAAGPPAERLARTWLVLVAPATGACRWSLVTADGRGRRL